MIRHQYRLRSRTGIKALPTELLRKVHGLLPLQDLKSAVLVDKRWNSVGEDPSLWSQAGVRVSSRADIAKLSVGRLARLEELWIAPDANLGNAEWELFFQNIEKREAMKCIWGLGKRDFRGVDPGLLARAMNRVEEVLLWRCPLTPLHFTSFFNHLAMGDSKIKKLVLDGQDMKGVDSGVLARALNRVEEVILYRCQQLTPQQWTSFFYHLAMRDSKIKKLRLYGQDLSVVPTDDLSIAVSRVEEVWLDSTRLTTGQLTSVLRHIVDQETKVKRLSLDGNDLSAVEGNLIKRAKKKLSQSGGLLLY